MAACTSASWALVRASTAMLDQRMPGRRDCLARKAVHAASSASLAWAITVGTGPSTRLLVAASISPRTVSSVSLSRSTAVATATTCGVQRWFSSSRMTFVPRRISGNRYSSDGSAPLNPYTDWLGSPTTKRSGSSDEQGGEQPELGRVHILHLVDEQVAGPPAHPVGERGITGQRVGAGRDEIVEVEDTPPGPLVLVADVGVGHLVGPDAGTALGPAGLDLVAVGGDEARLGPSDLAVEGAHPAGVARDQVGQQATTVGEQLRLRPATLGSMLPEESECGVVEGSRLDPGDPEGPQPCAELLGRFAAEGGDQGAVRLDGAVAHPAGHPQGQHPGLSGPGPGHDAEQRVLGLDGGPLGQGETARAREGLPGLAFERHHHMLTVPNGCSLGSRGWSLR